MSIFEDCFEEWEHLHIGPLIQGAAWEIRPPRKPRIKTRFVVRGRLRRLRHRGLRGLVLSHLHRGTRFVVRGRLRERRRNWQSGGRRPPGRSCLVVRCRLNRRLSNGKPGDWGLRLFNGGGEEQITFMLPNPFLTDEQRIMREPDWSRLDLWDRLRQKYLGLEPDPLDRTSPGFSHA